jgi:hypothetical protein
LVRVARSSTERASPDASRARARRTMSSGMADTDALARQNPFLQVQDAIQRVRPVEQLADARQRQAEAFERHDLMQPRDLVRAVGPPVGLGSKRLHEPALFVEPERLDRHAEPLGGLGGAEMSVLGGHSAGSLDRRLRLVRADLGAGSRGIFAARANSVFRIRYIMGNIGAIVYLTYQKRVIVIRDRPSGNRGGSRYTIRQFPMGAAPLRLGDARRLKAQPLDFPS